MRAGKVLLVGIVSVLTLGILTGCAESPTTPQSEPASAQLLEPTQEFLNQAAELSAEEPGLARGWVLRDTKYVRANRGAVLGGWRTLWNYVVIPPNTLTADQVLTFRVSIDHSGAMVFSVNRPGRWNEEITFQSGKMATLKVRKLWLNTVPDVVVNVDTEEEYAVTGETRTHYIAEVPHFSRWAWGWIVY